MTLEVKKINKDDFSQFGSVFSIDNKKPNHQEKDYDWWPDLVFLNKIDQPYGVGMSIVRKHAPSLRSAERHMKTQEFCMSLDGDIIIVVGPANYPNEPTRLPKLTQFAAFLIPEGEAVVLDPGIWHWVPFPIEKQTRFFVVFASGTSQNDLHISDFPPGEVLEFILP